MSEHANLGMNKTGIATSPRLSAEMVKGQDEFAPDYAGDEQTLAALRIEKAAQWSAPLGSVPPPTTVKGVVKTGMTALKGESPTLLIDKLGARLAFERSGVRLYTALLTKFDAIGGFEGGPSRAELEAIMQDEYAHFRMLTEALAHLGADPTVMTPSADLEGTITQGALAVLVDPRANLAQSLAALLTVELIDNDCWLSISKLAEQAGQAELATRFRRALAEEEAHLLNVRRWVMISEGIAER